MSMPEGTFRLYSHVDPPLAAGTYRFRATQSLTASDATGTTPSSQLPVEPLDTVVRVRSPRYQLPPDQVLSVYPPAGAEGSFGSRLPQVVVKRRTLPWERDLAGEPSRTPWLALVVVAEGEGVLEANQPVAQCVTPGRSLEGPADVPLGSCLAVTRSVVHRVFPTRKDVPLLAHAREVDVTDTDLMLGDDDGFLAVVIANRLPVSGRDDADREVPVRYLACLVNLESQFDLLLPEAPPPAPFTAYAPLRDVVAIDVAQWDRLRSGQPLTGPAAGPLVGPVLGPLDGEAPRDLTAAAGTAFHAAPHPRAGVHEASAAWSLQDAASSGTDVYLEMARPFSVRDAVVSAVVDPVYRFPVLLHWSFTSSGDTTFRRLMERLDSGLIGTLPDPPQDAPPPPGGRRQPPPEVVETGHVGLPARTRTGDAVRDWYRGPLVPHPPADPPGGRLPLAHVADQLRIVVPDGREDVSLAAAFEIGRLLALAHPSSVAALQRWRAVHYRAARGRVVADVQRGYLEELLGSDALEELLEIDLGVGLGRHLARLVVEAPETLLGPPRLPFDPGRPLALDGSAVDLVAAGFRLDAELLTGGVVGVLAELAHIPVPVVPVSEVLHGVRDLRAPLQADLVGGLVDLVSGALAPRLVDVPVAGPTVPRTRLRDERVPDRLDAMLDPDPHPDPDSDAASDSDSDSDSDSAGGAR